jgi:leader peptidase (prepilin peptidase)/N-methyltransferase
LATSVLLVVGLGLHQDWHGLLQSGVASATSGMVLWLCWRFAGAGYGDVRLATLGGLGLGHATVHGGGIAVAVLCAIIATQAIVTLTRGGNRTTTIPLGPALAAGFLLAGAL